MIIDRLNTLYDKTPVPPPQVVAESAIDHQSGYGQPDQPAVNQAGLGADSIKNTAPPFDTIPYTNGCGQCGCREYKLTRHNLWSCTGCGKLYPFITGLEPFRSKLPVIAWLKPCALCFSPWMVQSAINQDHYFCPDCNPIAEKHWNTLVLAGKKPVFVKNRDKSESVLKPKRGKGGKKHGERFGSTHGNGYRIDRYRR
jgi:hypothetical protein